MSLLENLSEEDVLNGVSSMLQVPSQNSGLDGISPPIQGDLSSHSASSGSLSYRSRRTSARIMSAALKETLKNIRRNQHKLLVQKLKLKHARYYTRQRCCECITMSTLIVTFTMFAFYIVLSYGFYFGIPRPFELADNLTTRIVVKENEDVSFLCQTDHPWEYCRWFHFDSFCDFERVPPKNIKRLHCDWPSNKVSFLGNYSRNECGIRLHMAELSHRGIWQCEMEKYYLGFSRRYGELKTFGIMLVVEGSENNSLPTRNSPITTTAPVSSVSYSVNETEADNVDYSDESEEYQRVFFFLRVFILGGMGFVLGSLALMFWLYFMYLWRTWESHGCNKIVRSSFTEPSSEVHSECSIPKIHREDTTNDLDSLPMDISQTLYESRRKSVSFAVATINDKNTYSLERKTVRISSSSVPMINSPLCVPSIITTSPKENAEQFVFDEYDSQKVNEKEENETVL